jgi:hypothetical protein
MNKGGAFMGDPSMPRFHAKSLVASAKMFALAMLICSSLQSSGIAAETIVQIEEQKGVVDNAPAATNDNNEQTVLNGGIEKSESAGEINSVESQTIKIEKQSLRDLLRNSQTLFKLMAGASTNPPMDLGKQKPMLTSEEYRMMEYGVIGLDALTPVFGSGGPTVTGLLKDGPAEKAGMRKGDLLVKAKDHVFKHGEAQRVLWQIVGGRAGTPVDVTVLRNGELITFHLIRMNIEDITDRKRRRQYEFLLNALGPPRYESDGDLAESTIKDKQDLDNLAKHGGRLELKLEEEDDP